MICILAMVVFGIMGIFSATHRKLAKEAFDCVFRRITLRPCKSGFDQKMKGKIVGKLLSKSPRSARFVNKHFEVLSWIMVIIFIISMIYSGYAVYNIGIHGSCTPEEPDQCVFTPDKESAGCDDGCGIVGCSAHSENCVGESCDCVGTKCYT